MSNNGSHLILRGSLLLVAIVLLAATTGCTPRPTRPPVSADEVRALSTEYEKISKANIEAWNSHDTQNMRPLYTDDIAYYESDINSQYTGMISVLGLNWLVIHDNPKIEGRQAGTFVNRDSGFDIWEMWNWGGDTMPSSPEHPITAYDRYTLRDGKIATWFLFWDAEFINKEGFVFSEKALRAYETAWSSGDTNAVATLYAPDAVRHDALFGDDQNGPSAIKDFAAKFFSWYPGVRLERLKSFGMVSGNPIKTGGVYAIHASDQAGRPCDVRAIILLDTPEDKITNESLYYQADSLIACGWAH